MIWSSDFAYAVGLITTDGSLSKDGRHISFTSKDYEQVVNYKKILGLTNKIGLKASGISKEKKYFVVQFGDVKLYRFLLSIGLCPNKSKVLGSLDIPNEFFNDFLRGCLDGDGFTHSYWDKRWKSSFMLYTGFVSASKPFLEWLKNRIATLYFLNGTIKKCGKSAYQLMFAKKSSILLLKVLYYSDQITFLKRKHSKIEHSLGIIAKQCRDVEMVDEHV
jgi:hypothetical protein